MKKALILIVIALNWALINAQVPQGFNYQAIARDGSGNPIINTTLQVLLYIQADTSASQVIIWEELHSPVKTNAFGLFSIVLGTGVRQSGSVSEFSAVNWNVSQLFVRTKIYYSGQWKTMGNSKLWSVPYSMSAGNVTGLDRLEIAGTDTSMSNALFEVRNNLGQTVFAVYNEGIRAYVDDGDAKGSKGGFAIGGFSTTKAPSQELFRVTRDSTRVYVNSLTKGLKGGFAIGGFSGTKATVDNFLNLTPDNYFIGHNSGKNVSTGRYNSSLGYESGINITSGESNSFIGYQSGYNNKSGSSNLFLGYKTGYSNIIGSYNTFVGYNAGYSNTEGLNNSFLGSFAGRNNTTGNYNIFVGDYSGFSNTIGENNSFVGTKAGYNTTSGYSNSFIGNYTGYANTLGSENVFIGNFSGYSNIESWGNVYIGNRAGYLSSAGWNNVFIGTEAGYNNVSGQGNVFIGYKAGLNNTNGWRNIFIGNNAGDNQKGSDKLIIDNYWEGDSTKVFIWGDMQSRQLRLNSSVGIGMNPDWHNLSIYNGYGRSTVNIKGTGDANEYATLSLESEKGTTTKSYLIAHGNNHNFGVFYYDGVNFFSRLNIDSLGRMAVGSWDPGTEVLDVSGNARFRYVASGAYSAPLNITANGTLTTSTSDISMKTNISAISGALEKVVEMNGVSFSWKDDPAGQRRIGFIAQEMEKVIPEVVFTNPNDGLKGINYPDVTAVLASAIKEQQRQIESYKSENDNLRSQVRLLEERVQQIESMLTVPRAK